MKNYKPVKAYAVIFNSGIWAKYYALTDFLFDTKEKAQAFKGIQKADVIEVLVTPIKKI